MSIISFKEFINESIDYSKIPGEEVSTNNIVKKQFINNNNTINIFENGRVGFSNGKKSYLADTIPLIIKAGKPFVPQGTTESFDLLSFFSLPDGIYSNKVSTIQLGKDYIFFVKEGYGFRITNVKEAKNETSTNNTKTASSVDLVAKSKRIFDSYAEQYGFKKGYYLTLNNLLAKLKSFESLKDKTDFTKMTVDAITAFQKNNKLSKIDGLAGPETLTKLKELGSNTKTSSQQEFMGQNMDDILKDPINFKKTLGLDESEDFLKINNLLSSTSDDYKKLYGEKGLVKMTLEALSKYVSKNNIKSSEELINSIKKSLEAKKLSDKTESEDKDTTKYLDPSSDAYITFNVQMPNKKIDKKANDTSTKGFIKAEENSIFKKTDEIGFKPASTQALDEFIDFISDSGVVPKTSAFTGLKSKNKFDLEDITENKDKWSIAVINSEPFKEGERKFHYTLKFYAKEFGGIGRLFNDNNIEFGIDFKKLSEQGDLDRKVFALTSDLLLEIKRKIDNDEVKENKVWNYDEYFLMKEVSSDDTTDYMVINHLENIQIMVSEMINKIKMSGYAFEPWAESHITESYSKLNEVFSDFNIKNKYNQ